MKKKLLVFLMCLLVLTMAFCLVACNKQTDDTPTTTPHTHTYSESWSSDADYHWHEATCEHSDEISSKAIHTWNNGVETNKYAITGEKKYTCTVCGATKTENKSVKVNRDHQNWTFYPVGNKIYFNFTTVGDDCFYINTETQQYFEEGITAEDNPLIISVELYKDGDFENTIELEDYDCTGWSYYAWESVEELEEQTKYYAVITLDKDDYEEFIIYISAMDKPEPTITFDEEYPSFKAYDGEPYIVSATATLDEEEFDVIIKYCEYDDFAYYFDSTVWTTTPPTEVGKYYALAYTIQTDEIDCGYDYFDFTISDAKELTMNEDYCVEDSYLYECGTEIMTAFLTEENEDYILYVNQGAYSYVVKDASGNYWDFAFEEDCYFYTFEGEYDGYIYIIGTRNDDGDSTSDFEVGVYDTPYATDKDITIKANGYRYLAYYAYKFEAILYEYSDIEDCYNICVYTINPDGRLIDAGYFTPDDKYKYVCYELNIDTYYVFEFENVSDEDLTIPEIAVPVLHLGHIFEEEIVPTATAPQYTKWNAKIALEEGESYYVGANAGGVYSIIMFNKDDLDSDDTFFDSSDAAHVIFTAPYTGYYDIVIEKMLEEAAPSSFCVVPIQEMTDPFDSESANNSYSYSAYEIRLLSFELSADCTIKFNGSFGKDNIISLISSDLSKEYYTEWKNYFQQVELTKGIYYIGGSNMQDVDDVTINYYLVCGHNFGEDNICDVCEYTCEHGSCNVYGVCDKCGQFVGDTLLVNSDYVSPTMDINFYAYYKISLSAGKYAINENKGVGCTGYNYYVYKEGATSTPFSDSKEFTITDAGIYYIVIEDENLDSVESGNSFKVVEDVIE